jgi:fructokinase
MGGLSTDFFGDMLADSLRADGVSLDYVARLPDPSTLAFVQIGEGEPHYAFFDAASAHRRWTRRASPALDDGVKALHVGSLTLIEPPVADEILSLMREQKGSRVLSIDPNCRPTVTHDLPGYRIRLAEMFKLADIIKLSAADLEYLQPGADPDIVARGWIADGSSLVVLTRGGSGATAWTQDGQVTVAAEPIQVVDTVGAGDSFIAATLFQLDRMRLLASGSLAGIGPTEAETVLSFAVRVAAITCSRAGANPPTLSELEPAG